MCPGVTAPGHFLGPEQETTKEMEKHIIKGETLK